MTCCIPSRAACSSFEVKGRLPHAMSHLNLWTLEIMMTPSFDLRAH